MKMRTSGSLDSKIPRLDFVSEEKSPNQMKKSSQLILEGHTTTSIEQLKTRIKNISQIVGEIRAKNSKIQTTAQQQENFSKPKCLESEGILVKEEANEQKNKNQFKYRSLIDRVNESILKSSKYGIKSKAQKSQRQRTKNKINQTTCESPVPKSIFQKDNHASKNTIKSNNGTPIIRKSRSFINNQISLNIQLIKKYSNSPKQRPSKKFSINSSSQNISPLLLKKCLKTRQYDQNRASGGFVFGKMLGRGKFGSVYLAEHIETRFIVAIKRVPKQKIIESKMVDRFIGEIKLHLLLDHPNIVKCYGFFEEKENICLILEYLNGGTLFDCLNQVYTFPEVRAVKVLRQVIDALDYLHEKNIIHRDIKPQNIVLSSTGIAKLCDFGWSTRTDVPRSTFCGTLQYASPQMLCRQNYDSSVDVWCVGILTYQMLIGRAPFENPDRRAVMEGIVNIGNSGIPNIRDVSLQARQFIEAILQADPEDRPQIYELTSFALFKGHPQISMLRSRSFVSN